jgi:hypothetical protein
MKRLIAIALIIASTSAFAQHGHHRHGHNHNGAAIVLLGGIIIGGLLASPSYAQPQPSYQPYYAPQTVYVERVPGAPMYGDQCPIVNGYQTYPIYQTNVYGYQERVGCGFPR